MEPIRISSTADAISFMVHGLGYRSKECLDSVVFGHTLRVTPRWCKDSSTSFQCRAARL